MVRLLLAWPLGLAVLAAGCAAPGALMEASPHVARCAPGEQPSVNDLLYFGLAKANGTVTQGEWAAFLRDVVTPRFPAGLTAWPASGQWRDANGLLAHEASNVLALVHPDDEQSEKWIRAIVSDYKSRFMQEAVLRVKSAACVAF